MLKGVFSKLNIPIFSRLLDGASIRQRTISENVANVSTPGYQTKEVDFSRLFDLQNKIEARRMDSRHIPFRSEHFKDIAVYEDKHSGLRSGQNNVDIDKEMSKSAENQLYYSATSRILAGKFRALHTVIRGRS